MNFPWGVCWPAQRLERSATAMPIGFTSALRFAVLCGVAAACSAVVAQDVPVQPASRPAPDADDEIIVYGSVPELRRQLLRARDAMIARWNDVNGDDKFDIHCKSEATTGSRIKRESCVSNIWAELDEKVAQAYLGRLRGETGAPPEF